MINAGFCVFIYMAVAKVLIVSGRLKCFSDGLNFSFAKSGCWCRRVGGVFVGEKDLTVEVAVNLGHVEVVHTVGMEQLFVRRCRMIPKFCQGILVSNAGNIIIGTAENLNWHIETFAKSPQNPLNSHQDI